MGASSNHFNHTFESGNTGITQVNGVILVFAKTVAKASGMVTAGASGIIGLGVGAQVFTALQIWRPSPQTRWLVSVWMPLQVWPSTRQRPVRAPKTVPSQEPGV
jgi:hypothetical protein